MKKSVKSSKAKQTQDRNINVTKKENKMAKLTINSGSNRQADNDGVALDPMNPEGTMILLGKFKVETEYFEIIESRFSDIAPFLLEDVDYTAQDLIGEDLWSELAGFGQRHAVLCLKHMATLPDVPLCDVSCPDCGTTSFQIV